MPHAGIPTGDRGERMRADEVRTDERLPMVYIAGKISGKDGWEIEENIRKAEAVSLRMWKQGIAAICVHSQGRFMVGVGDYDLWLPPDYEIIRRSDALYMVKGWRESPGAVCENAYARTLGKLVFSDMHSLLKWSVQWRLEKNGRSG